jgi:hypothetical protein
VNAPSRQLNVRVIFTAMPRQRFEGQRHAPISSRLTLVPMCMGRLPPSNENRKRTPLGHRGDNLLRHPRERRQMFDRALLTVFHAARCDDGMVIVFDLAPRHFNDFVEPQGKSKGR